MIIIKDFKAQVIGFGPGRYLIAVIEAGSTRSIPGRRRKNRLLHNVYYPKLLSCPKGYASRTALKRK